MDPVEYFLSIGIRYANHATFETTKAIMKSEIVPVKVREIVCSIVIVMLPPRPAMSLTTR